MEVENKVFLLILEYLQTEDRNDSSSNKCRCKKCEQVSKISTQNYEQDESTVNEELNNKQVTCDKCEYKCLCSLDMNTHKNSVHINRNYKCDLCEYESKTVEQIRHHKLAKHTEEPVNQLNHSNSEIRGNKSLVEQNAELIQELLNVKKTKKDIFAQIIDDFENGMKEV